MGREVKNTPRKAKLRELRVANPQRRTFQGKRATLWECNFSAGKAEKAWFPGPRRRTGREVQHVLGKGHIGRAGVSCRQKYLHAGGWNCSRNSE